MTKVKKNHKVTTFEGLPLVDAAEDVALAISKHDTTTSRKKDPSSCAAALAGRREFHTDVRVYMSRMYVLDKKNKRWIRFVTPMSVQKEIVSFDRGATFEPGEYVFKAPQKTQVLGHERRGGEDTRTGKKKRAHRMTANVRVNAHEKMSVNTRGKS